MIFTLVKMGNSSSTNYKHEINLILRLGQDFWGNDPNAPDADGFSYVEAILVAGAIYGVLKIERKSEYDLNSMVLVEPITKAMEFILFEDPVFFPDETNLKEKYNEDQIRLFVGILLDTIEAYKLKEKKSRWVTVPINGSSTAREKLPYETISSLDNLDDAMKKIRSNIDKRLLQRGWSEMPMWSTSSKPDWSEYKKVQYMDLRETTRKRFNRWMDDIYEKLQSSRTAKALKL
jgi:hypothetical protein